MKSVIYPVFILLGLTITNPCCASGLDATAGKCLSQIVTNTDGKFLPSTNRQKLMVGRRQFVNTNVYGKTITKETVCQYEVAIAKLDSISKHYIPTALWTYNGPGLIFTDGLWHAQSSEKILKVQPVHLFGQLQQILVYSRDMLADGGYSELQIFALTSPLGNYRTLLDVTDHGELKYEIATDTIGIIGTYYGPTDCLACGHLRQIRLRYDPEAKQLAIVNPDQNSAAFFKQIEKH